MAANDVVFVDSSAWYALVSSSDSFHRSARVAYSELIDSHVRLYTTSYVLVETFALVHRRLSFEILRSLVDSLSSVAEVYWIGSRVHRDAWNRMTVKAGQGLSFVDWSTVVAAEEFHASIFAFDQGLRATGAMVIPV
ncbi:MAG TPA: PIN domain-containing protein [Dehalococcoidia bacterium]|nr:PIN domain-containing protein [Dehalococcoidia bacterium]